MNNWIFQGKPSRYDLETELVEGKTEHWTAYQNNSSMSPGDIVFFWRAAEREPKKRGLYGWGRIIGEPILDEESGIWVPVRYECRFPKFIPFEILKDVPKFATHQLFSFAIGTNFKLTDEQYDGLKEVIVAYLGAQFLPKEESEHAK